MSFRFTIKDVSYQWPSGKWLNIYNFDVSLRFPNDVWPEETLWRARFDKATLIMLRDEISKVLGD